MGVEPTVAAERRRPPVLKTGTITGPHALPLLAIWRLVTPIPKIKQDPTLYKVWVDERVSPSRVLGTEPRLQAAEPNLL